MNEEEEGEEGLEEEEKKKEEEEKERESQRPLSHRTFVCTNFHSTLNTLL